MTDRLVDQRLHIIIQDHDDGSIHNHGIVVVPDGMDQKKAQRVIGMAYLQAKKDFPKTWTYGDVLEILKGEGFGVLPNIAEWLE